MAGVEVSERSPFLNVSSRRSRSEEDCCIVCVGSTGSGKSSTVSIMTGQYHHHQSHDHHQYHDPGQHIMTSDSVSSVTTECQLYTNLMDSRAASWLDTVGWEDRKKDDMESFRKHYSLYF